MSNHPAYLNHPQSTQAYSSSRQPYSTTAAPAGYPSQSSTMPQQQQAYSAYYSQQGGYAQNGHAHGHTQQGSRMCPSLIFPSTLSLTVYMCSPDAAAYPAQWVPCPRPGAIYTSSAWVPLTVGASASGIQWRSRFLPLPALFPLAVWDIRALFPSRVPFSRRV